MIGVTFFGVFLTPVFYVTISAITAGLRRKSLEQIGPAPSPPAAE